MKGTERDQVEKHQRSRRNYAREICGMLKVFFSEVNWRNMKDLGEVQQAYYFLLNKYKMKVKKYVPI